MNNETVISVKDVHKSFKLYYDKGYSLKEMILFSNRRRYEQHNVLNGISFDVKRGEAIGLIGHNGCGKSTMLKLLTRIMYPDSGTIDIKGRVSSLIELGAGFHPDMSGRENIYTNAAIFGLTKKEIDERIRNIIDFSEIEEFIDNPVRTYSSGMYMRLAFSVAINVDADILLIDEILGVGDVSFQTKCFNRLQEIKSKGTTIVIVSHALGQIEQICDRSIWIHDGLIKKEGKPKYIHMDYYDFMLQKRQEREAAAEAAAEVNAAVPEENVIPPETAANEVPAPAAEETAAPVSAEPQPAPEEPDALGKRWGNQNAQITAITVTDAENTVRKTFKTGSDIFITIDFIVKEPVRDAIFGIGIFNRAGVQCYGTNTRLDMLDNLNITKDGRTVIHLKNVSLLPAEYLIDIAIETGSNFPVDYYREACTIEMISAERAVGITRIDHEWKLPEN